MIQQHPTRFAGFALLPMADTNEAVKELTRCANDLGFKGAMISGTFNGTFFDEEQSSTICKSTGIERSYLYALRYYR